LSPWGFRLQAKGMPSRRSQGGAGPAEHGDEGMRANHVEDEGDEEPTQGAEEEEEEEEEEHSTKGKGKEKEK
jgi:hypothetical protein